MSNKPVIFHDASVRANEVVANQKLAIGTSGETSELHIKAAAPEFRMEDKVGAAASETAFKIYADGGKTYIQSGVNFNAGSASNIIFGNMGSTESDCFLNIGSHGIETSGNIAVNNIQFQQLQGLEQITNISNTTSNTLNTTNTTAATSTGTGAITCAGGLGVAGNVYVGSQLDVSGKINSTIEKTTAHSRESAVLKKYPEVAFADGKFEYNHSTNTYTQGGYTVSGSSSHSVHTQYRAFDGDASTFAHTGTGDSFGGNSYAYDGTNSLGGISGYWHKLQFPQKIKLNRVNLRARSGNEIQAPKDFTFIGSNDDTNWTTIQAFTGQAPAASGGSYYDITSDPIPYKYLAIVTTKTVGDASQCSFAELEYYGYEETNTTGDTAVDATITSVYNTPDLTSASLYIDGKKSGSTPTDYSGSSITVTNNGSWDSAEKAWTFDGDPASNLVSADLGLEGDQPHSVSAWVKADVLNGDGLFHLGTTEGEGDGASRVGFVDDSHISWGGEDHYFSNAEWHNVTYTYNGEGSDKKLYLDGRLVGSAKNEDTFGEYPPFAMSTYSEHGYTVSASTEFISGTNQYRTWEAFDDFTGATQDYWSGSTALYSSSSPYNFTGSGDPYETTVSSTLYTGDWIQIQLPHKIKLDYITFFPRETNRFPRQGVFAGSNDGQNWDLIHSFSGLSTSTETDVTIVTNSANNTKAYKYIRLVITHLNGGTYAAADNIKLFGHRENDLVRFPDPTNVLKYPHVAMTGPAQRGYVASASSEYSDYNYPPYNAFNNIFTGSDPTHTWNTQASAYHTSSDGEYNGSDNFSTTISGTPYAGEWIQIELPHKVVASALKLGSYGSNSGRSPRAGAFAGSNDGSTWDLLKTYGGETSWTQGTLKSFEPSNNTTTAYKYFRFVITHVQVTNDGLAALQAFEVHGTEEDSDVVARIGDGFDGKVRNLRVYSTALSQDWVQEIFDADKDEFELAKSSVSVYRGHLGIGTTEPKAALTVMDEVGELEEFPPRPMTDYETYMEGHGVFRVRDSGHYINTNNGIEYPAWYVFNHTIAGAESWYSLNGTYYDGTDNSYSGTAQMTPSSPLGDYIMLELPYRVKAKAFVLYGPNYENEYPRDYTFYGSNDGELWTNLLSVTGAIVGTASGVSGLGTGDRNKHEVDSSTFFKYFAIIITKGSTARNTYVGIDEWRILGTREQGASTLHNGELSLTRNLTVPRIGPALDADDTPRRDRLVVEYNTSTNNTENGVVKDTSGHGWDANFYGSSAYDATEKAITLSDGTDDYLETGKIINGYSGDIDHTFALWVKPSADDMNDTNNHYLGVFGSETAQNKWCGIAISDKHLSHVVHSSVEIASGTELSVGIWQHVAVSYRAGGSIHSNAYMDYYINGEKYTGSFTSGGSNYGSTSYTLDLEGPLSVRIGSLHNGSEDASSSISNFKLYDVALTADEVKRLYDMGRLGNVVAQPVHIAAPVTNGISFHGYGGTFFYDEGSFSPTFVNVTVNSYAIQEGWYVRIGRLVTIHVRIQCNFNTNDTSAIHIANLPYTGRVYHTPGDGGTVLFTMDTEGSTLFSESSFTSMGAQIRNGGTTICITDENTYVKYNNCTQDGLLIAMFQYFI
jgi:hypothetical protein